MECAIEMENGCANDGQNVNDCENVVNGCLKM
jgi:hypothetical protein